jgi:hypothetical protein
MKNYPEESVQLSEHGEILKSRMCYVSYSGKRVSRSGTNPGLQHRHMTNYFQFQSIGEERTLQWQTALKG